MTSTDTRRPGSGRRSGEGIPIRPAPTRTTAPEAPDPERVKRALRLHELAKDLQRRASGLSYQGAVLMAARLQDAQPAVVAPERVDDDRGSLHREAAAYMTEHATSYRLALFAVAQRRAAEMPRSEAPEPLAQADNAELHAAAVVRMAREPGTSYRDALLLEARTPAPPSASAGKVTDTEAAAPTEAEVTAYMKANGGTYKAALIALMTAAAAAQKEA